ANENPTIASLVLDDRTAQALRSTPAALRSQILPIIQRGFADAMHDVFFVAAFVAIASAVLALSTRSRDVPRAGASQRRGESLSSQSSGNGAAPGRTAAPSANGARPEPAGAATPVPEPSSAATLAALGITVATPPRPNGSTSTDERNTQGELARLRELAALTTDELATEALTTEALTTDELTTDELATDELAADELAADELITEALAPGDLPAEPETAAPMVPSFARIPAVQAWPGWAGWQAPHEDKDQVLAEPAPEGAGPEEEVLAEAAPEGAGPEEEVLAEAAPEGGGHEDGVLTEPGPEGADAPIAASTGRRWVRGQVTAATGEPLAGALVTLVTLDGDEAGHAIAGSDGVFAVGDMLEGTYTLIAAAPHFRPAASTFALSSEEAQAWLNLFGIGSMTGKVTTAKDGLPMSVDIELVCPDGEIEARYRTGKDGCFSLTDVLEGSYELVVRNDGYRTVEVPVVVDRAQTLAIEVALIGVGHLYGAVTGPGGGWVPGVQVTLTDRTGTVVATTGTDGAGSYRFSEIPEGPYTVGAAAFGAVRSLVEVEAGSTVSADVNLASL
ncbi:MAG TPA: carboxypeptidase regulatory-like domain-containing protein, partial [Acidimicrobiales bacterium]|nr:carboxypeptidase regulatory-like domain-containing protein [Acidimicrobiales bacterium]